MMEQYNGVEKACYEVLVRIKEAIEVFDPNADYSGDQVMLLSLQVTSEIMPPMEAAMVELHKRGF